MVSAAQYPMAYGGRASIAPAPVPRPRSFHVVGRDPSVENGDICGEYTYASNFGGYPAYQNRSNGIAIRFFGDRWLMDRGGFRNSDICVAFAFQVQNCNHPAHPELIWHVWEAQSRTHVEDTKVAAIDAPEELTFVGREHKKENSCLNGKYVLTTLVHGRAAYFHESEDLVIHFLAPEGRWLISDCGCLGSSDCSAYAQAGSALHPGDGALQWHFLESGSFVHDPRAGIVNAPEVVNVIWRAPEAENARINGTYQLVGINEGRALYAQPGTSSVIRYSAKNDRWLIDCDGFAKPGVLSRLSTWVLTGDSQAAADRCTAWANARGTEHPGHMTLQWHVWETSSGQHKLDESMAATSAPQVLQVSGRDVSRQNSDLNGEYQLVADFRGLPAYQKSGTDTCIYFSKQARWVIDRRGMAGNGTGVFVAYADANSGSAHPAWGTHTWHVHETRQGAFVPDPAMSVTALCDAPSGLPMPDQIDAPVHALNGRGMKRGHGMDSDLPMYAPQAKLARTANPDGAAWLGIFGA